MTPSRSATASRPHSGARATRPKPRGLLIEGARSRGVTTVIAHTLAELNASTRVLANHGFTKTDTIEDSDDGALWRWQLSLTS